MPVMPSTETVTVLFSDVVGSTALLERFGPEAADRMRREHFLALRAAVFDHPVLALSVGWSPEPPGAVGALGVPLPGFLALDARVPFVARPSEWEVLERAWAGAREGPCRAVLVGGDAGTGKTRLVSEFAR